jgi:K+-transporting ATPase ATPase B chain
MTHKKKQHALFEARIIRRALIDSLKKLDPRNQVRNPVMFVVEVGSILTTLLFVHALFVKGTESPWFILGISVWLWATVLFANFAESVAEGRGKAGRRAARFARISRRRGFRDRNGTRRSARLHPPN